MELPGNMSKEEMRAWLLRLLLAGGGAYLLKHLIGNPEEREKRRKDATGFRDVYEKNGHALNTEKIQMNDQLSSFVKYASEAGLSETDIETTILDWASKEAGFFDNGKERTADKYLEQLWKGERGPWMATRAPSKREMLNTLKEWNDKSMMGTIGSSAGNYALKAGLPAGAGLGAILRMLRLGGPMGIPQWGALTALGGGIGGAMGAANGLTAKMRGNDLSIVDKLRAVNRLQ